MGLGRGLPVPQPIGEVDAHQPLDLGQDIAHQNVGAG
jgi:hypothetical protein